MDEEWEELKLVGSIPPIPGSKRAIAESFLMKMKRRIRRHTRYYWAWYIHRPYQQLFGSPTEKAHLHSSYHRQEILQSKLCACFCCCQYFPPNEIKEWIDEKQTALCPRCGIDAVLGDAAGFELTPQFLAEMEDYWFGLARLQE